MSVHAFVDESKRGQVYLIAAVIADPAQLSALRRAMLAMLLPGQREIHFAKEKERRRRALADMIARLPIEANVYARSCIDKQDEPARQACLDRLTQDLIGRNARRLVIDSRRERDKLDSRVIREALGKHPRDSELVYEHVESTGERLLWIADIVGWCYGAGGLWRRRIEPILADVIHIDVQ